MNERLAEMISKDFEKIKAKKPLLHHITNMVVMNETANLTLCLGALPVMAHTKEEVSEMVRFAGALILNIGTITPELIDSMIMAGKTANELNIPIVLDPVGAGATTLRTESTYRLLDSLRIDIIRGNAAEVSILAGHEGEIKGVESLGTASDIQEVTRNLALERDCVVAITGKEDVVSDGKQVALVANGDPMMSTVTGTGCMATTVIGAFASVQKDYFLATVGGLVAFGLAGEFAARESNKKPGTFHVALYDAMAFLTASDILSGCKAKII